VVRVIRLAWLVAIGALVCACGSDHGSPRVRALPAADGYIPVRGQTPRSPRIANYKIDATLDVVRHHIDATQTLTWKNTGQTPVTQLPFHLYLNAFKNERSLFIRTSGGSVRGGDWTTPGWINVTSVTVAGADLLSQWKAAPDNPEDETVYELTLPAPVQPGESVDVSMKFDAQLPEVFARTGYKGEFHLVAQWFPKIGVRTGPTGAERWECAPFHGFSEFFADFGTYDVQLTVPNTYVVAATGVLKSAIESPGGTRTFAYRAEDVHDFAWMADPYMEMTSAPVQIADGSVVEVRVWARPEQHDFAERHLEAATGAIERFSDMYLPYPWPIMTVIDPPPDADAAGGMEYPTFVTTGGDMLAMRPGVRIPEFTTVHEVGHNWFQGILATNETAEPWLDEGVNEWADHEIMDTMYGVRTSGVDWMGWQANFGSLANSYLADASDLPVPIASAPKTWPDLDTGAAVAYFSTTKALTTLAQVVGPKKFAAAMKAYAEQWAFKHPTGADFFATLSAELGQDLGWFVGPAFHEIGSIQLAIRDAHCVPTHPARGVFGEGAQQKIIGRDEAPDTGSFMCAIVVSNTGPVRIPVDIELKFADNSTQRIRWEDHGGQAWERFVVERSTELTEVWLDPDGRLALANPTTLRVRVHGDGSASMRASAYVGSMAQTLMQVVGP
jgi:hypothetical protein